MQALQGKLLPRASEIAAPLLATPRPEYRLGSRFSLKPESRRIWCSQISAIAAMNGGDAGYDVVIGIGVTGFSGSKFEKK